jgi:acyl-CoA thioesterase FadM
MHVNNGRVLTMLDLGRFKLLHDTNLLKPTLKRKWFPVLGSAKIHFLRPLFCWQKLDMHTKVVFWDEKWIYLEQSIYVKDKLKATAILKAAFLSKQGLVLPQQIIDLMPSPPEKPEMPRKLQAWLHAEKQSRV